MVDPTVGFGIAVGIILGLGALTFKAGEYYGRAQENLREVHDDVESVKEALDDA